MCQILIWLFSLIVTFLKQLVLFLLLELIIKGIVDHQHLVQTQGDKSCDDKSFHPTKLIWLTKIRIECVTEEVSWSEWHTQLRCNNDIKGNFNFEQNGVGQAGTVHTEMNSKTQRRKVVSSPCMRIKNFSSGTSIQISPPHHGPFFLNH